MTDERMLQNMAGILFIPIVCRQSAYVTARLNNEMSNLAKATFSHGTHNKNVKVVVTDHGHELRKETADRMSTRSQNLLNTITLDARELASVQTRSQGDEFRISQARRLLLWDFRRGEYIHFLQHNRMISFSSQTVKATKCTEVHGCNLYKIQECSHIVLTIGAV